METLKFKTDNVLTQIRQHRQVQADKQIKAAREWKTQMKKALEDRVNNLRTSIDKNLPLEDTHVNLLELRNEHPCPQDMLPHFDLAIDMLSLCIDEEVSLTQKEFMNYMNNDWDWTSAWSHSNSKYLKR